MAILSRDEARALTQRLLGFSTADQTRITVGSGWSGNTRFAASEITTAGGITDTSVTITSTVGRRRASASTNVLDDAALKRTVELSERLARLAPEDPEIMPELAGQQYAQVSAFVERTADLSPEARAHAAQTVIDADQAKANRLSVAGFIEANAGATAVATNAGLFAYHASTDVSMSTTARTPDGTGSGYAVTGSRDWADVNAAALGRRAADKALASRNPQAIEPGMYTGVLEPKAVADVLLCSSARSRSKHRRGAQRLLQTRRLEARREDRRLPGDDLLDPRCAAAGAAVRRGGIAVRRIAWSRTGAKNLSYSRFWAERRAFSLPVAVVGARWRRISGGPPGGSRCRRDEERGRARSPERSAAFSHALLVHPLSRSAHGDGHGPTRDGTFLIENGKITRTLKNFRWNESPLFMLNKIGSRARGESEAGRVIPGASSERLELTSLSDASDNNRGQKSGVRDQGGGGGGLRSCASCSPRTFTLTPPDP